MRKLLPSSLAVVAAALLAAACQTDRAAGPGQAHDVTTPGLIPVKALLRTTPLPNDIYFSALVGPAGDSLKIKDADLKITVPPGALSDTVTITVHAFAGSVVAYDFGPHMTFNVPLQFQQGLKNTTAYKLKDPTVLQGAFFADPSQLNLSLGTALVDELEPTNVDLKNSKLVFNLGHFSGYMVSSGRADIF